MKYESRRLKDITDDEWKTMDINLKHMVITREDNIAIIAKDKAAQANSIRRTKETKAKKKLLEG